MAIPKSQLTFSWKNYLKPTPENLQMVVEGIHGALIVVIGTSWSQGASPKVLLWLALAGYALDKLSKFFAKISHDAMQVVEISAPVDTDMTITKKTVSPPVEDTTTEKLATSE